MNAILMNQEKISLSMQYPFFRKLASLFSRLPVHPQWLVFKHEKALLKAIAAQCRRNILDIGCGRQLIREHLNTSQHYIGLDYLMTASCWYRSVPQIYGDGQKLPVRDESMDTVLLLDVLEHLPDPDACVREIHRILKPEGQLILQVPFIYPLHDAPRDFHRWTAYGLQALAARHSFRIINKQAVGTPLDSCAITANIGMAYTMLKWVQRRHLFIIFSPLIVGAFLVNNLAAWLLSIGLDRDDFMPVGFCMTWEKPREAGQED